MLQQRQSVILDFLLEFPDLCGVSYAEALCQPDA
jgi:hypothetical protein